MLGGNLPHRNFGVAKTKFQTDTPTALFAQALQESFGQAFSKACAGGGREALLVLRRGRNPFIVQKRPNEGEFSPQEKRGRKPQVGFSPSFVCMSKNATPQNMIKQCRVGAERTKDATSHRSNKISHRGDLFEI